MKETITMKVSTLGSDEGHNNNEGHIISLEVSKEM